MATSPYCLVVIARLLFRACATTPWGGVYYRPQMYQGHIVYVAVRL